MWEDPDQDCTPLSDQRALIGEEEEVIRAAAEHAASVHGHEDTPELREQMREFLEPADAYSNEPRAQEPLPG